MEGNSNERTRKLCYAEFLNTRRENWLGGLLDDEKIRNG